jgi:long-chain acyl-CoA synthetase
MSIYDEKPWLSLYDQGQPAEISLEFTDALSMFRASVRRNPDGDIIRYFGGRITARELDELSDAFAVALTGLGVRAGDRVALYLQNVPQFVIGMLAAWKAGGIAVPVNPMYRARELDAVLRDSGTRVLVCLQSLYRDVVADTDHPVVVTTSELEYRGHDDQRVFSGIERIDHPGAHDMAELIDQNRGQRPPAVTYNPGDTAFLTYTSGTTGPPKGAMNTHGNVVFNSQAYRQWCGLGPDDVILGVAPLFHITGLIAGVTTSLLLGAPLVLAYRFEPSVMLETIRDERATFTVGSITVFIALMNAPRAANGEPRDALASLTKIWSGGAPIPPSTVKAFQAQFGQYIHNIYGLTETTSPSHGVPFDATAPVDDATGALSVGVPVFNTVVRVVGDDGRDLPAGEVGEIVTSGPMVVPGYWNKPEETEHALPGGALHTGDVGYMDADGWFYLIDRKKDQINAGGYKVWPREVEDVLYQHEAVREAAVVGVPDAYRGETVKAYVSLRPGQTATAEDLIAFCREQMAAYKYPRQVEFLDELPKTVSGKLLRRELRDRG